MKLGSTLLLLLGLAACHAPRAAAPRLAVASGLAQVTIVSKGLE